MKIINFLLLAIIASRPLGAFELTDNVQLTLSRVLSSEDALRMNFGNNAPAISLMSLDKDKNFILNQDQKYTLIDGKKYFHNSGSDSLSMSPQGLGISSVEGLSGADPFFSGKESLGFNRSTYGMISGSEESLQKSNEIFVPSSDPSKMSFNNLMRDSSLKSSLFADLTRESLQKNAQENFSLDLNQNLDKSLSGIGLAKKGAASKKSNAQEFAQRNPPSDVALYNDIMSTFPGIVLSPSGAMLSKDADMAGASSASTTDVAHVDKSGSSIPQTQVAVSESELVPSAAPAREQQSLTNQETPHKDPIVKEPVLSEVKSRESPVISQPVSPKAPESSVASLPVQSAKAEEKTVEKALTKTKDSKKSEEVYAYHDKTDDLLFSDIRKTSNPDKSSASLLSDSDLKLSIDTPLLETAHALPQKRVGLLDSSDFKLSIGDPVGLKPQKLEKSFNSDSDKKKIAENKRDSCQNVINDWNNIYKKDVELVKSSDNSGRFFCYKPSPGTVISKAVIRSRLRDVQTRCSHIVKSFEAFADKKLCLEMVAPADIDGDLLGAAFKDVKSLYDQLAHSLALSSQERPKDEKSSEPKHSKIISKKEAKELLTKDLKSELTSLDKPLKLGLDTGSAVTNNSLSLDSPHVASGSKQEGLSLGLGSQQSSMPLTSPAAGELEFKLKSADLLKESMANKIETLNKSVQCDRESRDFQKKYQRFLVDSKKIDKDEGVAYCYNISSEKSAFNEAVFKQGMLSLQKSCDHLADNVIVNPDDIDRKYCIVLKNPSKLPSENKKEYWFLADSLFPKAASDQKAKNGSSH